MRIYLIRHGQTEWNAQHKVMGRSEIPLDVTGEAQVQDLAQTIGHFPIQKIISSPQLRAQQTAQALAVVRNIPVHTDERLCEVDFPRWQGKTGDEIKSDEVYIARRKDYMNYKHEGFESFDSLMNRIESFVLETGKKNDHIAVVSHGDVIKGLIIHLLSIPPAMFFQFKIQNASCTILTKENDKWVLELMNYTPTPLKGLNI